MVEPRWAREYTLKCNRYLQYRYLHLAWLVGVRQWCTASTWLYVLLTFNQLIYLQVASRELHIPASLIHITETNTSAVPNTCPSAASFGTDANGMAVKVQYYLGSPRLAWSQISWCSNTWCGYFPVGVFSMDIQPIDQSYSTGLSRVLSCPLGCLWDPVPKTRTCQETEPRRHMADLGIS